MDKKSLLEIDKQSKDLIYHFYTHDALAPIYNDDTQILIFGSFPSSIRDAEPQYYKNKKNCMRKLLKLTCGIKNEENFPIDEFKKYGIGFFDVVESCYSSEQYKFKDDKLLCPKINFDLFDCINKLKNLKLIVVTGNLAWKLFTSEACRIKRKQMIFKIPSTSGLNRYRLGDIEELAKYIKPYVKKERIQVGG